MRTLERAARAAAEVYFGPDAVVVYPTSSVWTDVARAVLMAVRLQTTDGEDYVTSMDEVMFNERLDDILAEGE